MEPDPMNPISMHDASAPVFAKMLGNMLSWLEAAKAHAEARKFSTDVYLTLRLAPDMLPFTKQIQIASDAAHGLYQEIRQALESGQPRVLELTCEKDEDKRVSLLSSEILAVQTYEKSATGAGSRRPGFALEA